MTRLNRNKKALSTSAFFTYVKRFWWILPLAYICIWAYYQIKKLIDSQETKLNIQEVKNNVVKTNVSNTNSSTSDKTKQFNLIKQKFKYSKNVSPKTWDSLKSDAENLALALGTHAKNNRAWFDMDNWFGDRPDANSFFEDEKKATDILIKYPNTFPILEELYYKLFTRSRNLKSDIVQYIPEKSIIKLKQHYKKFGKTWL